MPLEGNRINAVTLGEERCDDVRLAAAAAGIKGASHHVFPLEKGAFYRSALMFNFGPYYRRIPWQQAGVPISWPEPLFKLGTFCKRASGRVKRDLRRFGLPFFYDSKLYFNICETMCYGDNFSKLRKILEDGNAVYREYMPDIDAPALLNSGRRISRGDAETVCRAATFEIWMRQVNGDLGFLLRLAENIPQNRVQRP